MISRASSRPPSPKAGGFAHVAEQLHLGCGGPTAHPDVRCPLEPAGAFQDGAAMVRASREVIYYL